MIGLGSAEGVAHPSVQVPIAPVPELGWNGGWHELHAAPRKKFRIGPFAQPTVESRSSTAAMQVSFFISISLSNSISEVAVELSETQPRE